MTPFDFTEEVVPGLPEGHGARASSPLQSEAKPRLPKGHAANASHPSDESDRSLPNGQSVCDSSLLQGAATGLVPKGQSISAASDPSCEAVSWMPQGQGDHASQTDQSSAANVCAPQGHGGNAALALTIDRLREMHRRRQDLHRAEKSLTLQARAICRRVCEGDKKAADKLYAATIKGEEPAMLALLDPYLRTRAIFESERAQVEKQLERDAKTLPVAEWVKTVSGFGWGSLAAVIGEAGDLSNYPKKGHLWKRMGLAVIDGGRQRRVAGDAALDHGYSPVRRSIVWNIGACILKSQSARLDKETGEVTRPAGPLRELYDQRKAIESERTETAGHAHNRAQRYIEKRVLRDLWQAWKRAT